jgi:hypothetical protein
MAEEDKKPPMIKKQESNVGVDEEASKETLLK